MDCVGICISAYDMRRVFNPELLIRQTNALVDSAGLGDSPEELRQLVEKRLKAQGQLVVVKFIDPETEVVYEDGDIPDIDYALTIEAEAPYFSRATQ